MAVFTAPVTDDFNRNVVGGGTNDLGPPNWGEYTVLSSPFSHAPFAVGQGSSGYANRIRLATTSSSSVVYTNYWIPLSVQHAETYITLISWPTGSPEGADFGLFGRIQNPATTAARAVGFTVGINTTSITGFRIAEFLNYNEARLLGSTSSSVAISFGDVIGMRLYERADGACTIVEGWTKRAADANQWKRWAVASDFSPNRIVAAGPFGMRGDINITGQTLVLDDYSVAEMTPLASSINIDAFPNYTGAIRDIVSASSLNTSLILG